MSNRILTSRQKLALVHLIGRADNTTLSQAIKQTTIGEGDCSWESTGSFWLVSVYDAEAGGYYNTSLPLMGAPNCDCGARHLCWHSVAAARFLVTPKGNRSAESEVLPEPAPPQPSWKVVYDGFIAGLQRELVAPLRVDRATERYLKQLSISYAAGNPTASAYQLAVDYDLPQDYATRHGVQILPTPPRSIPPWEALLFSAWKLGKLNIRLPGILRELLTPALQEKYISHIQRASLVQDWTEQLGNELENLGILAAERPADTVAPSATLYRLVVMEEGLSLVSGAPNKAYKKTSQAALGKVLRAYLRGEENELDLQSREALGFFPRNYNYAVPVIGWDDVPVKRLRRILVNPELQGSILNREGEAFRLKKEPLKWLSERNEQLNAQGAKFTDYHFSLKDPEGLALEIYHAFPGAPALVISPACAWPIAAFPFPSNAQNTWKAPAEAIESTAGLTLLQRMELPLPEHLATRTKTVVAKFKVKLATSPGTKKGCLLYMSADAHFSGYKPPLSYQPEGLIQKNDSYHRGGNSQTYKKVAAPPDTMLVYDTASLPAAMAWLEEQPWKKVYNYPLGEFEAKYSLGTFPEEMHAWFARRPAGIELELDPELSSLLNGSVAGSFSLEIEESEIDWFDLQLAINVTDLTLSKKEIDLLLAAPGKWVSIPEKGWRKLEMQLSEAEEQQLAELGLSASQLNGSTQRFHALHLANPKAQALLPQEKAEQIRLRVEQLKLQVTPPLPKTITAELRPYQLQGFHFLAFLSTNHFGGILADDMGLGKTLQTLAWIAWLRTTQPSKHPSLVVCPKSVCDNWSTEAARFYPTLKVLVWSRETIGSLTLAKGKKPDLIVINYAQMRGHEATLAKQPWQAVVLDEAQNIKNPTSLNAKLACGLRAAHRVALSGTPIENKVMDLWSIMAFAMPGTLGTRANFARTFDQKTDPLARRRLGARVRPFLLRRTKKEVAQDLPDRTEEDISCELDGTQAMLYKAELKRAQANLLNIATRGELDKARFNILTSLLRLRQICCHPSLIGYTEPTMAAKKAPSRKKTTKADDEAIDLEVVEDSTNTASAKLSALLDILEPLMEEGHKVLVFSQFVDMLNLIREELSARQWQHFILTGQTEDRGPLVDRFQNAEGGAVFLISLKAGGSGLNLTAASYVVLYDPWWNPAVEAQAIDRTHRIGQTQKVIAYRLVAKGTIEEKIRALQKKKGDLAKDILGEEAFAQALTIDDFQYLLGD